MRTQIHIIVLTGCLAFAQWSAQAQDLTNPRIPKRKGTVKMYSDPVINNSSVDWKSTRLEFMAGGCASGFLGDLGGQDAPGKPFVFDYEPVTTRYAFSAGARYFLREYHALRGYFTYAEVRGDDALTSYPNRRYRNINFKSPIAELSAIYEFHLFKPSFIHFAGANTTKLFSGNRFGSYLSAGVGMFYFNPKGKLGTQYYALQPLRTEGQDFPDAPSSYSRVAAAIPMGGGIYMLMNHNITLGLDFGLRWTSSDYIDDASGYYYDNNAILARDGKLAAYFANPSVALGGVPEPYWYTENQPRGGSKSNDTYMFLQLTLSKSFTPTVNNRDFKPQKKRRIRAYPKSKKKQFEPKGRKNNSYNNKRIKKKKRKFKAPKLNFGKRRKRSKITTF